jgi:signal peptidase I
MTVLLFVCAGLSFLYSALCFIPTFGTAFWAFPLTLSFSSLYLLITWKFLAKSDRKNLAILKKILEYLPFVLFTAFIIRRAGTEDCSYILDLVTVAVWVSVSALSAFILFRLSEKRLARNFPDIPPLTETKKSIVVHLFEWIDALLQAACLVLLINLFIFQLYAIPSESMVPEFMVGDRVVVVKTPSGPKFPLSEIGFPRMRSYKRGDIVVFNNPHYNDTKEARVRSFTSQLVYMLTFTSVNINRDEFGAIKADPLVKRITGVPGEKLMMVDGVLYSKRAGDPDFSPIPEDAVWSAWNIASLPKSELAQVQRVPLSLESFSLLESVESTRANLDVSKAAEEARQLVVRFAALKRSKDTAGKVPDLFPKSRREFIYMFQSNDEITRILLTTNGGLLWFDNFMTAWTASPDRANIFDRQSFRLNLLLKLDFGRLVVRNAELFAANSTSDQFAGDIERNALLAEADTYREYMSNHDQRNMGEFPEGKDKYIPENCFFMMGDNRFNSLDMRHSYEVHLAPIDAYDSYSFVYRSILAPQYVPVSRILGSALFRFWPLSRAGVPE